MVETRWRVAFKALSEFDLDEMYPSGYTALRMDIRKTEEFSKWLDGLTDIQARARVMVRIERLAMGNPGDVKAIGEGVS